MTLSATPDTRNGSGANGSSFSPLSAFVLVPRYTPPLIRTAATGARLGILVTPFLFPSPEIEGDDCFSVFPLSPVIERATKTLPNEREQCSPSSA